MYASHLNFLSANKRKLLLTMLYLQFFKGLLEIFLCIVSLACIILLGGQWVMQTYFNTLAADLTYMTKQHADTNRQIHTINTILKRTDTIQSRYNLWTPNLVALFSSVPDAITIDTATLDASTHTYVVSGSAASRDDLLQFRDRLQKISFVDSVDIPLSQLTFKEKFPFSLTIKIKK
jgi:Tfp pilus assembly protein PilN